MGISTVKMTARQFLELGEDPVGVFLELVNGEIAIGPSQTPDHSYVSIRISSLICGHIGNEDLGQVYGDLKTIFGPYDVRRPDVLFVAKSRLALIGDKAVEGPPDLCVEILSPSSTKTDRADKFELYWAGGVSHYWIIDPDERTIEGHRLEEGVYVLSGRGKGADVVHLPPFPELAIPLSELWRP